jgi:hypothetical protein
MPSNREIRVRIELSGLLGLKANTGSLDRINRIDRILIFAFPEEKRKAKSFTACELCFLSFFRKLRKKEKIREILLILSDKKILLYTRLAETRLLFQQEI